MATGHGTSARGRGVAAVADRVEPVPAEVLPAALKDNPAGVSLFKQEFRAAQRLRSAEGVFIPEVLRTTHPPDLPPQGVAAAPAPSYVTPMGTRPAAHKPIGPGALHRPSTGLPSKALSSARARAASAGPGRLSEGLNTPGEDWLLTRRTPRSASPLKAADPAMLRPTSALDASLFSRVAVTAGGRMSSSGAPPPGAGGPTLTPRTGNWTGAGAGVGAAAATTTTTVTAAGAYRSPSPGTSAPTAEGRLPRLSSPGTYTSEGAAAAAGANGAHATAALGLPPRSAGALPAGRTPPGTARTPPPGQQRPVSAVPSDLGAFIQEVADDEGGLANEDAAAAAALRSRPPPSYAGVPPRTYGYGLPPRGRGAVGVGSPLPHAAGGSATWGSPAPGSAPGSGTLRPWTSKRTGFVETTSDAATSSAVHHLRAASAQLRKYSLPPTASAISPLAVTYARKPKAAYSKDLTTATPCERIANNYSPLARGLSPRTLEILSPGGISPSALGPLPHPRWREVDEPDQPDGVPEADSIHTAAKRHISFMPLELFDDLDLELHTPQQWLELGRHTGGTPAETLIYSVAQDRYVWTDCSVMGYDEEERAYIAEYIAPAIGVATATPEAAAARASAGEPLKSKKVKRLNLRFKAEDPAIFEQRLQVAKAARELAESELRLFFYIDSLSAAQEVLHTYNYAAALERVAEQVRGLSQETLQRNARGLLDDAADFWERATKRAVVEYRRLDPLEEGRLMVLRLPPRAVKPPAPPRGLLPVLPAGCAARSAPFREVLAWGRAHLFVAVPQLHVALLALRSLAIDVRGQLLWCMAPYTQEFKSLMEVGDYSIADAGVLPFPLRKFEALQTSHLRRALKFVDRKAAAALALADARSAIAPLFHNGTKYAEDEPLTESHAAFVRQLSIAMNASVHSLVQESAEEYTACLERYTMPQPIAYDLSEPAYGAVREVFSTGALLTVSLQLQPPPPKQPSPEPSASAAPPPEAEHSRADDEADDHAPHKDQDGWGDWAGRGAAARSKAAGRKAVPVAPMLPPMLGSGMPHQPLGSAQYPHDLHPLIALVPPEAEFQEVAGAMLDDMLRDMAQVADVFKGAMPPQLQETSSQGPGEFDDDPVLARLLRRRPTFDDVPLVSPDVLAADPRVAAAKKRVEAATAAALERAEEVAVQFENAALALMVDMDAVLASLEPMSSPLEYYHKWVGAMRSAAQAAAAAAPSKVHTGLLLVDTTSLKAELAARAAAAERALLDQLLAKNVAVATRVCERCEAMAAAAMAAATSVRSTLEIKAQLVSADEEMSRICAWLMANRERDAVRFAYRHATPDADAALLVRAQSWPKAMADTLERAWSKVEAESVAFQMKLRSSRDQLVADLVELGEGVLTYKEIDPGVDLVEAAHQGRTLLERIQQLTDTATSINEDEGLLGWEVTTYPTIAELATELEPYASLWMVSCDFTLQREDWLFGPVREMDADKVEASVTDWYKKMARLSKALPRAELRQLAEDTRAKLEEFKEHVPIIMAVCNPGMRGRHWERLSSAVGHRVSPNTDGEVLSLDKLLKLRIQDHMEVLQEVSDAASRELALERSLDRMMAEWAGVLFELAPWKNTGAHILKGSSLEEAQLLLDDHTIKAQAMVSSPAAAPFLERIEAWVAKLAAMQDIFDAWMLAQQKWMYLGPVYGSEEIAKQMPKERYEFQAADMRFCSLVKLLQRQPEVLSVTNTNGMLSDLQSCNSSFSVIERSLNAYLESKKMLFPRFFFLSNDELIEVLSEAKEPTAIQPFAKKIFEAVSEFEFTPQKQISALLSQEGERIPLERPVITESELVAGVEFWLLETEKQMRASLATITNASMKVFPNVPRERWILQWPGQVVLAVSQTYWTKGCVDALAQGGLYGLVQWGEQCNKDLLSEVMLVRGKLTGLERATIGALVVLDVHGRDVVAEMVTEKVGSIDEFGWQSRLRYYWVKDALVVAMLNAQCAYGYEYLGNSSRLVITPLTDRCYRTLLGAHHMNLGGAPAGPAGTGKTETTKDLGKALAIQCVVFNCSDGLDYLAMGRFFKGLAASGAWACFDEFNRIELEVLSVVAQQVLTIQRAKGAGKIRFLFEGTDMALVATCNVFITMNPGYAGRSELPDNLKALFRDVAMMVPDYAMIAEIILYSYGYLEARAMALKLVMTYRLCSEQLSSQDHYDYGMRAVMAVLRAAGNLKRRYASGPSSGGGGGDSGGGDDGVYSEPVLMLRAITDVNLPKFLDEDVPLFRGILSDLFPGVVLPAIDYTDLHAALSSNARAVGLQPLPAFLDKAVQLYEMVVVRHGLMLVGQSYSMKTAAIRVLAAALGDMCAAGKGEHKTKLWTINPKAVTLGQLYGQDDPLSKEWTDGVLAVAFRTAARDTSPDRKWVVLDGPVDAIWIENMNTVLDDNKKLCLNSGEIIAMQGLMNMIFEVQDLAVASPATVSRCGMVYMQPSLLGWRPVVESWMQALPEAVTQKMTDHLLALCDWLLPPCLRMATRDCVQPVPVQEIALAASLTKLLRSTMGPMLAPPPPPPAAHLHHHHHSPPPAPPARPPLDDDAGLQKLEALFLFALVWSVGAAVDSAGRQLFSDQLRRFLKGEFGAYAQYVQAAACPVRRMMPPDGSVYDWVFDTASGTWRDWMELAGGGGGKAPPPISPDTSYSQIIVTTADVVRYSYLVDLQVQSHVPLLLVGPTGTGKSAYINAYVSGKLDRTKWAHMVFNFSAQTSANMTQDIIDGKLDKRRKGVYGPPVGKRCAIFVDDLNMPQLDRYGAQPPIELLRQVMDHGGWYNRHDLTFRRLVDVQFLAAMGPPGGGRNPVTNRYVRHFHLLYATEFSAASLGAIFGAIASWWFAKCKYSDEVCALRDPLVAASLALHAAVSAELLPTPTKTHYVFNLRDLSKLFGGMVFVGEALDSDPALLQRLWVHEALRVYSDRLVDEHDREWLAGALRQQAEVHFGVRFDALMARLAPRDGDGTVGAAELRSLLFGDFMTPGQEPRRYVEITDAERLSTVVGEYLKEFNASSKQPLSLVLFAFCLEHICRVARTIRQHGGHALLVGVGGSGRQSVTTLAAFIEDFHVFSTEITSSYGMSDWHDDLKAALRYAGERGKDAVLCFKDSQIIDETMVEELSSLLNTGEVPNLFDTGEAITMGEAVRSKARQAKMDGSRADLWNFVVQQVRQHLRVVLCFSPVGDAFRERLRRFPSLTTCTTIDWFTTWPDDALASVATQALADQPVGEELRASLAAQCVGFHKTARHLTEKFRTEAKRHYYVTPTSYLQLLECFKTLLARQQAAVVRQRRRYEVGLEKLAATEASVLGMQAELEQKKPRLIESGQETAALIALVEKQAAEADKVKALVQAEEAKASQEADKVGAIKQECQQDLAQALPAYNAAIKALNTLTKNDISEVKGMKAPPAPVRLVMQAVCILKGLQPTRVKDTKTGKWVMDWWESSKRMLSDMAFLDSLKNYDKDNIPPEVIDALQPLLSSTDFQPAKIKKVSQAAFGLCNWVRAMDTYDRVAKVVAPKRAALAEAEQQLEVVKAEVAEKQARLAGVEADLSGLRAQLEAAKAKKAELEADVRLCEEKLDRAHKLISGLGGEKVRWSNAAEELAHKETRLTGDMLLSSGVVAYLGAFSAAYRQEALGTWGEQCAARAIPCSPHFSLVAALGDPVAARQWAIWGLPKDDVSATNGIVVFESSRWPLCIDPQGQANKWIRNMEASRSLLVLKPATDPSGYLRALASALPLGRPVLLEGLGETLDASLEPLLLKQTFKSSGMQCVRLGDQVIEWGPGFRMFLTTKLRNPHYPPEVCTRVVLLNFSITPAGLEDQLLGLVVAKERPDLEEEKNRLIVAGAENARKLFETEDQILAVLSSSQGNILDDGEAVQVLQAAKALSDDIAAKQQEAAKTEQAIDKARTAYQPIAKHASVLYFCVAELASIDPMYQFSLAYFLGLFLRAIEDCAKHPSVPRRLALLQEHFTAFLFTNVCRALFEKDKLLFALSLAVRLQVAAGKLAPELVRFFITGALSMDNPHPNPAPEWLSEQGWSHLCELEGVVPQCAGLRASIATHRESWRELYDHPTPHNQLLPGGYQERLDAFQRLTLLRCAAPDKLVGAVADYVAATMGPRYTEHAGFKLSAMFGDSSAAVPLIFVLSPGSDPMADLLAFADDKRKQVDSVSLGQGQGPIAERQIDKAMKEGTWVVLQNCHLAKSFLPRLEVICEQVLAGPSVHAEFRLWLTSYPADIFPTSILENGLKMTTEPPKGLRAGMERIYKSEPLSDRTFLEGCGQEAALKHLTYALAFFHCVVVGRRSYGPVGWNIPYAFNENDLRISMRQLRMFLDGADTPPLAMLRYTAGECNYGGKVTDGKDRRTLMTLLDVYYNQQVAMGDAKLTASGAFAIPELGDYGHYVALLAELPSGEPPPDVYGLHANAAISRDLAQARLLLDSLAASTSSLPQPPPPQAHHHDKPKSSAAAAAAAAAAAGGGGAAAGTRPDSAHASSRPESLLGGGGGGAESFRSRGESIRERSASHVASASPLASPRVREAPAPSTSGAAAASSAAASLSSTACEIRHKLPAADFDVEAAARRYPITYMDSMNTVLLQELGRANALLQVIRRTLDELARALRGEVVMSGELERVAYALSLGKVPDAWLAKSFPSLKPLGPYVKELLERVAFFSTWLAQGPPAVFWISGFFFTQAFLTAAKQNYARKQRVPIDMVDLRFDVRDRQGDCSVAPEDGVCCQGMFLEAAAWDYTAHRLCESAPKVLFVALPPVHFLPARLEEVAQQVAPGSLHYTCPLYKTSERRGVLSTTGHSTNFVCDVVLPSEQPEAHWVMRGAALLLSTDS